MGKRQRRIYDKRINIQVPLFHTNTKTQIHTQTRTQALTAFSILHFFNLNVKKENYWYESG